MRTRHGDPRPGNEPEAALEAAEILHGLISHVAEAGRLRVGVERAARMIHATTVGVVLSLLATAPEDRDPRSFEATREAILAAVTTDAAPGLANGRAVGDRVSRRSVALKAVLNEAGDSLTPAETALLSEWLDRITDRSGR